MNGGGDPVRRIARRRRLVSELRGTADRYEADAADLRARADRLEASTDALQEGQS